VALTHEFNRTDQDGQDAAFLEAVKANDLDKVRQCVLGRRVNINARDADQNTALLWAVKNERHDMAQLLISGNAGLDLQDRDGSTALMEACKRSNVAIARALIDKNASIVAEDRHGNMAFFYAKQSGLTPLIELFAAPMKRILEGISTPMFARALRDHNVGLNTVDPRSGETPMTLVARYPGQEHMARAFIEAGADLNAKNRENKTPLEVARAANNLPVVKLIEDKLGLRRTAAPVEARPGGSLFSATVMPVGG
jgi:ankyrin repeat protein